MAIPWPRNPRFGLPRLRPGQPGNHQAQAQSVEIRQAASQPLRQGDGKTFEIGHAGENRRGPPLRTKSPPERAHRDGREDQPERRIKSKCVHGNDLAPLDRILNPRMAPAITAAGDGFRLTNSCARAIAWSI